MIQEELYINTTDDKQIFCTFDRVAETYSRKAVVIAHGLTGNPFEHLHMMARNYFLDHGYDVYKLAFYWDSEKTRKLDECTVKIHAQDLTQIISMAKTQHEKVYCAGHSYGGLTLLHSNPDISAISFWDSSYIPNWLQTEVKELEHSHYYTLPWGSRHLIGPNMLKEASNLTDTACKALAEQVISPSQIILAEQTDGETVRKNLYHDIHGTKELIEIEGADHCFYKGNSMDKLFAHTQRWFNSY